MIAETFVAPAAAGTNTLATMLEAGGIRVRRKVALAEVTYLRTGGECALMCFPSNVEQLAIVMSSLHATGVPYKVIGSTSNLLFLDDASYVCLVSTVDMNRIGFDEATGEMVSDAGAMLPDLSRFALYKGLTGLEGLEGIPGTVGGAVFMNAGAYGSEVKDTLTRIEVVHADGTREVLPAEVLGLRHRSSDIRSGSFNSIVARCWFVAKPGDKSKIFGKMELFHAKRHKYQDFMYPNLGSIFSGSPYRALGAKDRTFRLLSAIYYMLNYEVKPFRRESPLNRKWLNDLVLKRFPLQYELQPFSDKTLNCLVNRGQGTAEMVRFIEQMEALTEGRIPLENEIVRGF